MIFAAAALMAYVTDLDLLQLGRDLFCHRPVALFCFLHCEYSLARSLMFGIGTISSGT